MDADAHLDRLFAELEVPWHRSLLRNLADALHPPQLPPLQLTSTPVAVKDIWGEYRYGRQAGLSSTLLHAGLIGLLVMLGASKTGQRIVKGTIHLVEPNLAAWIPAVKPAKTGGGGGGDRSPLPASQGRAPRFAPRQFVPPSATPPQTAILLMEPTLVGQADIKLPEVNLPMWGDPLAKPGPFSSGPGSGGGIGSGSDGGIGPGKGPGYGPGEGGGLSGVYTIGGLVSRPAVLYSVEPEYSEEARKARFQGVVVLSVVIDERGVPTNFKILQPLGLGLDEKAVEAVRQWRFKPALRNGKPVAVQAQVDVTFRLL
jgi:periplasmic protein TonB